MLPNGYCILNKLPSGSLLVAADYTKFNSLPPEKFEFEGEEYVLTMTCAVLEEYASRFCSVWEFSPASSLTLSVANLSSKYVFNNAVEIINKYPEEAWKMLRRFSVEKEYLEKALDLVTNHIKSTQEATRATIKSLEQMMSKVEGDNVAPKPDGRLLGGQLRNVLSDEEVEWFAGYWCENIDDKHFPRHENLGQFIQRVAQYAQDAPDGF